MATFPRGTKAMPRLATPPRFPEALQSWSQSGKGQFRGTQNVGRVWSEVYPVLDTSLATVRALIEAINRSLREGVLWDVRHPYWHRRLGTGNTGGSVLIAGAGQNGTSINVDGFTPNNLIPLFLRAGDVIQIAGGAVLYDVKADVAADLTQATIPIHPPIYAGQEPADNAVVNINPDTQYFKAHIISVSEFPFMDSTRYIDAGLTVTWREQPQ